jgi:hypothetical protein
MVWILAACRGDAETYRAAVGAEDFGAGVAACGELADRRMRGDCLVTVMENHERLDLADCATVEEDIWREECVFLAAERLAAAGKAAPAMDACNRTRFARECSYHLLRAAARTVKGDEPASAAQALGPWQGMAAAPDAERLFWKAWWREQDRVDPARCRVERACEEGAKEVVLSTLGPALAADPTGFCADAGRWPKRAVPTPTTEAWVAEWRLRECQRVADRGLAPDPP